MSSSDKHEIYNAVEISHVNKTFNGIRVVDDVSFNIGHGEVFGMVGPNGAGKTTTIRMLMDIVKPDSGSVNLFGLPLCEDTKNRIGYLPEERGLYKKVSVIDSLIYLATLKNMDRNQARERALELLRQVNMFAHKDKKIQELSRGMAQIIQVLSTILHNPDLVVLDEPFSGLDPVNTSVLKQIILDLKNRGKSIIMSSHQMNEVETLCDRVLMINRGRVALYGNLADIRFQYRNNSIFVSCDHLPEDVPGVSNVMNHGTHFELFLEGTTSPQEVLSLLVGKGVAIDRFEISMPSLNEIFIRVVEEGR